MFLVEYPVCVISVVVLIQCLFLLVFVVLTIEGVYFHFSKL